MQFAPEEKPDGAPDWMVSFADMITILMSFFVLMFSVASGDANSGNRTHQQQTAIESLQYRFGPKWKPFMSWNAMPGNSPLPGGGKGMGSPARVPAVGDPGGTMQVLKKERARIRVPGEGDTIAIGRMIYFDQAGAEPAPGQDVPIQHMAEELAGKPQPVEIVATVSNRGLPSGCLYRDRWELGYARCRAAAALLTAQKIEPERLRLSVVPGNDADNRGEIFSDADAAVRVYLSATLAQSGK